MRPFTILILTLLLIASFSLNFSFVEASSHPANSVVLLPPDIIPGGSVTESSLGHYLSLLFKTLIGLAGGISVLIIAISGLQYIVSEVPGVKTESKGRIRDALI